MGAAETMRAVVLTGHGELDRLVFHDDWPMPAPGLGVEPDPASTGEPVAVHE